jgi:2'-5' RNA ligase
MAGSVRTSLRCFVGLPLPEAWQRGLDVLAGRLAGRLASRISWTRPGNWHVTLKFLGEVERARLPELCAALQGVDLAPVPLRLGGSGFFSHQGQRLGQGAPRTLWIGLAEGGEACARLAGAVDRALEPCGFAPEARGFRPHVTLGRVKQAREGDGWAASGQELERGLAGAEFARAWVGEMLLWSSVLGQLGPKYAVLKSFPARDHSGCPDGRTA